MATVVLFFGQVLGSKLAGFALDKALGVKVEGSAVGAWGQQITLAIFTGGSPIPGPTFEELVDSRFQQLDAEISQLRQDIKDLKNRMAKFEWQVETVFYQAREEDLWQSMLQIENATEPSYDRLRSLGQATGDSLGARREQALRIARDILTGPVAANILNARLAVLGEDVGAGNERVRGFLEIWKQQALRDADLGWRGKRLGEIYDLLEQKFTRALLIQVKCARLLVEAHEAQHQADAAKKGGADYFADTFHPLIAEEVTGFRNLVESLAVNLLPLPETPLASIGVPDEVAGMLAALDLFTARALSGKVFDNPAAEGARPLSGVPALSGCWGRVLIPGSRWIRRAPGSVENAKIGITANGVETVCGGTLEIRAVDYIPYNGQSGKTLHAGYQLYVGGSPRDMSAMLLAQFRPKDLLPAGLSGPVEVRVMDESGSVLARAQGVVVPVPTDDEGTAKVPFGTFTMAFTGGSEIKGK